MIIPARSKSAAGQPLQRCLEYAADKAGLDPYLAAQILSSFWNNVAEQLAKGNVVRIPGFGAFAMWLDERTFVVGRNNGPVCKPVFSAARGFQEQVRYGAPPPDDDERTRKQLRGKAARRTLSADHSEAAKAIAAFRESIRIQVDSA